MAILEEELDVVKKSTLSRGEKNEASEWKEYQKIAFRFALVFLFLFCFPTEPGWYKHLFRIDWANLHARDLYDIAHIEPHFVKPSPDGRWGIGGYINWLILAGVSTVVTLVWSLVDRKSKNYKTLYYWLHTLVRYRAALGIIGFSFEKIFPTQMPYPSLAHLSTNFGDFSGHKIYWTLIGALPSYQVFGGFVELIPGILLLFRKTATLGATLLIGALLTIAMANLGYDGGVHVYASYFVVLGVFLLWKDFKNIYNLLILERTTIPNRFYPEASATIQNLKYGVRATFAIYIVVFSYLQYLNFRYDPYKQPSTAGVKLLRGSYEVEEFRVNNKSIPYSPVNPVRWQDVTFEDWTTLTYRIHKPLHVELSNSGGGTSSSGTGHSSVDLEKNYEGAGVAGGRKVFHYFADSVNNVIYLLDKNLTASKLNKVDRYSKDWISAEAWKNIGNDNHLINKKALSTRRDRDFAKMDKKLIRDKMILHYDTKDGNKIILFGIDENRDSIYVVLNKVDKNYILPRSSIVSGSY
jgi:hypothetical protein